MRKRSQVTDLDAEIAQQGKDAEEPENAKPVPIMKAAPTKEKPGAELKVELKKDERDLFDHARPRLPDEPQMNEEYERVIRTQYIGEGFADHVARCVAKLNFGEGRSDHGSMSKNLDEAEPNARDCHNAWMTVATDRKRYSLDHDIFMAAMRNEATAALQAEKASGSRTKQITEADVAAQMQAMYPDAYRKAVMKMTEFENLERSMQNLTELALSKCRSAQTSFSKVR